MIAEALLTSGLVLKLVAAVETPAGIVFVDQLGHRHPAATIVSYREVTR